MYASCSPTWYCGSDSGTASGPNACKRANKAASSPSSCVPGSGKGESNGDGKGRASRPSSSLLSSWPRACRKARMADARSSASVSSPSVLVGETAFPTAATRGSRAATAAAVAGMSRSRSCSSA